MVRVVLPQVARVVPLADMREQGLGVEDRVLGRWVLEAAVKVLAPMRILALVVRWVVAG